MYNPDVHSWVIKRVGPSLTPVRTCDECGFRSEKDDPVHPDCDSFLSATRHDFKVGDDYVSPPQLAGKWVYVSCSNCGLRIGMVKGRDPVEYANALHGDAGTCEQKRALDIAEVMES